MSDKESSGKKSTGGGGRSAEDEAPVFVISSDSDDSDIAEVKEIKIKKKSGKCNDNDAEVIDLASRNSSDVDVEEEEILIISEGGSTSTQNTRDSNPGSSRRNIRKLSQQRTRRSSRNAESGPIIVLDDSDSEGTVRNSREVHENKNQNLEMEDAGVVELVVTNPPLADEGDKDTRGDEQGSPSCQHETAGYNNEEPLDLSLSKPNHEPIDLSKPKKAGEYQTPEVAIAGTSGGSHTPEVAGSSEGSPPKVAGSSGGSQTTEVAGSSGGSQTTEVAESSEGSHPKVAGSSGGSHTPEVAGSSGGSHTPEVAGSSGESHTPEVAGSSGGSQTTEVAGSSRGSQTPEAIENCLVYLPKPDFRMLSREEKIRFRKVLLERVKEIHPLCKLGDDYQRRYPPFPKPKNPNDGPYPRSFEFVNRDGSIKRLIPRPAEMREQDEAAVAAGHLKDVTLPTLPTPTFTDLIAMNLPPGSVPPQLLRNYTPPASALEKELPVEKPSGDTSVNQLPAEETSGDTSSSVNQFPVEETSGDTSVNKKKSDSGDSHKLEQSCTEFKQLSILEPTTQAEFSEAQATPQTTTEKCTENKEPPKFQYLTPLELMEMSPKTQDEEIRATAEKMQQLLKFLQKRDADEREAEKRQKAEKKAAAAAARKKAREEEAQRLMITDGRRRRSGRLAKKYELFSSLNLIPASVSMTQKLSKPSYTQAPTPILTPPSPAPVQQDGASVPIEETPPQEEKEAAQVDKITPPLGKEAAPVEKEAPQVEKAAPQAEKAAPQAEKAAPQAEKAAPQAEKAAPQAEKAAPQVEKAAAQPLHRKQPTQKKRKSLVKSTKTSSPQPSTSAGARVNTVPAESEKNLPDEIDSGQEKRKKCPLDNDAGWVEEDTWIVENIVDSKFETDKDSGAEARMYKVKWAGWGSEHNSWINELDFHGYSKVKTYWRQRLRKINQLNCPIKKLATTREPEDPCYYASYGRSER